MNIRRDSGNIRRDSGNIPRDSGNIQRDSRNIWRDSGNTRTPPQELQRSDLVTEHLQGLIQGTFRVIQGTFGVLDSGNIRRA